MHLQLSSVAKEPHLKDAHIHHQFSANRSAYLRLIRLHDTLTKSKQESEREWPCINSLKMFFRAVCVIMLQRKF